jgi:hypothetical protein
MQVLLSMEIRRTYAAGAEVQIDTGTETALSQGKEHTELGKRPMGIFSILVGKVVRGWCKSAEVIMGIMLLPPNTKIGIDEIFLVRRRKRGGQWAAFHSLS